MNNYPEKVLEYKVVKKFAKTVDSIVEWLMYTESDDNYGTWIELLSDKIEEKLIEIDMLLSKIEYTAKVNNSIVVDVNLELEEELKRAEEYFKALAKKKPIAFYL